MFRLETGAGYSAGVLPVLWMARISADPSGKRITYSESYTLMIRPTAQINDQPSDDEEGD